MDQTDTNATSSGVEGAVSRATRRPSRVDGSPVVSRLGLALTPLDDERGEGEREGEGEGETRGRSYSRTHSHAAGAAAGADEASGVLGLVQNLRRRSSASMRGRSGSHASMAPVFLPPYTTVTDSPFDEEEEGDDGEREGVDEERQEGKGIMKAAVAFAVSDNMDKRDTEATQVPVVTYDADLLRQGATIGPSIPPTPGTWTPLGVPASGSASPPGDGLTRLESIQLQTRLDNLETTQSRSPSHLGETPLPPALEPALDPSGDVQSLPPIDGGKDALLFVLGACLAEAIVWGLPYSVGVLHEYWLAQLFPDPAAKGVLTIASTLPTAMLQLSGAPLGPLFAAMPWHERKIQYIGLAISSLGLILSGFVTKPWQLVITFGILYPASGAAYLPFAANMFQWFNRHIGLATAAMICGTGIGGSVYPFIVSALLAKYGYRATMVSMGVSFAVLLAPTMLLNRRRLPVTRPGRATTPADSGAATPAELELEDLGIGNQDDGPTMPVPSPSSPGHENGQENRWLRRMNPQKRKRTRSRGSSRTRPRRSAPLDWSWLRSTAPWVVFACVLITSLGGQLPLLWIPSYAVVVNAKPGGTALVAIMNGITIPGNLLAGHLSDRLPGRYLMGAYCAIASVATVLFWGILGLHSGSLVAFGLIWSITAGCQPSTWPGLISVFAKGDRSIGQLAFPVMMSLRSVGTLSSGPISTALLNVKPISGAIGAFGHTAYGAMIIYVAIITMGGTLSMAFFPTK